MFTFKLFIKITTKFLIVIFFLHFSTLKALNLDKFNDAESIADYFSGTVLLNQSKYNDSYRFFKKLDGLEESHQTFSSKYLYSLINSGNFSKAFIYSKKLESENLNNFESDLIMGIFHFKNGKFDLSKKYINRAKKSNFRTILDVYILETLFIWSNLENKDFEKAEESLDKLDNRFENLKKIQKAFLNCFFDSSNTKQAFDKIILDEKTDFSRYNYFFAKYLENTNKVEDAKKIVNLSLKKYPRNLLLNQYKVDLENSKKSLHFNCKNRADVMAELLYIAANALSSQAIYPLSNFYLNLSKFLNKNFYAFDTLLAENFYKINDLSSAKKIYERLANNGSALKWYSDKQISRILIQEEKKAESLKLLNKSYQDLKVKGIYETFDYAEFLKNNEEFENSIKYYTNILNSIDKNHSLFPEATDGRGVSFERIGQWNKAEKDLLASLEASPNQAYVINYLAYSWIEQGVKIEKSLKMLEKANKIKSNDPYIIDSLGWALFKLKRYDESKEYLQLAVRLMPADPIVNDHYGDVLWKNGNKIQARYYWKYVLNLEKAEKDLKEKIEQKLIKGL